MDEAIETAAFSAGYMPERVLRLSEKASDVYDDLVFLTNSAYNNKPPEPLVAFIIGGVLCGVAFLMWVMRLRKISQDAGNQMTNSLLARAMIAAYLDNDDPLYTIVKLTGESFVFLGALQLDYQLTFSVMLGFFTLVSAIDSLRVLIAFGETNSIADFVAVSSRLAHKLKSRPATQLKPTNVYEDLSREKFIVVMVFITQVLLITFVVSGYVCRRVRNPLNRMIDSFSTHPRLYHHLFIIFLTNSPTYINYSRSLISMIPKPTPVTTELLGAPSSEPLDPGPFTFWVFSWRPSFCSVPRPTLVNLSKILLTGSSFLSQPRIVVPSVPGMIPLRMRPSLGFSLQPILAFGFDSS